MEIPIETKNESYSWACDLRRPFMMLKPAMFLDGNQWCALYGKNLQEGVAGFGDSPELASWDFDKEWCRGVGV
jgi:hypothetical protein